MKHISVRVTDELYEQAVKKAEFEGTSLSNFVREIVQRACDKENTEQSESAEIIKTLFDQLRTKDTQIERVQQTLDDSHSELAEARQRSDTIIMQLTQQLERTHLQLEDMRKRQTVWQKIKAALVPETG
jgi:predicted CopG family antitoxin